MLEMTLPEQSSMMTLKPTDTVHHTDPQATTIKAAGAHECLARLQRFGFAAASVEWLRNLDSIKEKVLLDFLETWENEYNQGIRGTGDPFQTAVPRFLKALDAATAEQTRDAARLGAGARIAGHTDTDNPFPPGTVLRSIWKQAFASGTAQPKSTDSLDKLFSRPTTTSAVRTDLPRDAGENLNEISATQPSFDRERHQHDYIEQQRADLESLMKQSRHHRSRIHQMEDLLTQTRKQWDTILSHAEQAAENLTLARAGLFPDATSETPAPRDAPSQCDPQQNPRSERQPHPDHRQDHGAQFNLECLQRGNLQKITECDAQWGLSPQQVARLKQAIKGQTVADLETFQRVTFNWEQAIPGFGESAINKLQDAHLAFRIKYDT